MTQKRDEIYVTINGKTIKMLSEHYDKYLDSQAMVNEYFDKDMSKVRKDITNATDERGDKWADQPDDGKEIINNQWMIHFADISKSIGIASKGFVYGNNVNDKETRQVTYKKEKANNNKFSTYNYAYLASDIVEYVKSGGNMGFEEFKEYLMNDKLDSFVMFKGNGFRFYHYGDSEEQVVFNRIQPDTKVLILRLGDNYCVMNSIHAKPSRRDAANMFKKGESGLDLQRHKSIRNPKNEFTNILYFSCEIDKAIQWVMDNYEQYRKNLKYNMRESVESNQEAEKVINMLHDFCNTDHTQFDDAVRASKNPTVFVMNTLDGDSFIQLSLRNFIGLVSQEGKLIGDRWFQNMGCEFDNYHGTEGVWVEMPKTDEICVLNTSGQLYRMGDNDSLEEVENDTDKIITVEQEYYSTPDVAYDPETGDEYSHRDKDAYPFVYLQKEDKLLVGKPASIHAQIPEYNSEDKNQIQGRIWASDNLVSFWQDSTFDMKKLGQQLCKHFSIPSLNDIKVAYLSNFGTLPAFIKNHPEFSKSDVEKREQAKALHLMSADDKRQDSNMNAYLQDRYEQQAKKLGNMSQAEYNHYRHYGMGESINVSEKNLREIVKTTITEALNERFEVLKDEIVVKFIRGLSRKCYDKLTQLYRNDPNVMTNPSKRIVSVTDILDDPKCKCLGYGDVLPVRINMDLSIPNNQMTCKGYFNWLDNEIVLNVNLAAVDDGEYLENSLYHEFTHICDSNHTKTNLLGSGYYSLEYGRGEGLDDKNKSANPINSIIYRLWTATERNAYTTQGISNDPTRLKKYIWWLGFLIETIEQNPELYAKPHAWSSYIGKSLFGKQYADKDWKIVVDKFIRKSRMLLDKFKDKAMQRHGQYNADMAAEREKHAYYDEKIAKYNGPNAEAIKEIADSFTFMIDFAELVQFNKNGTDWVRQKHRQYPQVSKQTLEFIWKKLLNDEIRTCMKNPTKYKKYIDWAKRNNYLR